MKLLRPRLAAAAPRLKVPKVEANDPLADSRAAMYQSSRWRAVRAEHMRSACAVCGSAEHLHVDHMLGHDDRWAAPLERMLNIPPRTWEQRFWTGPFLCLCGRCHSTKTRHELSGRLDAWMRGNQAALGLEHILWY